MPPKKKVIKEKKQKKVKQKQKQSQSQKVIINLNEVKTKPKRTRKKATNKNIKFDDISTNEMPAGWVKYGATDHRETDTLKGKINDLENKLLTSKPAENPVNSAERERILKIEEGMKNMFVSGNNSIRDLYSKFDQMGKSNFRNSIKEEEKQQSQPMYNTQKESSKGFDEEKSRQIFKTHYKEELLTSKPKKTNEEKKKEAAIYQKNYREQQKIKKANIIKEQEQRNNLNKDIITQSKIFDLSKKLKDEQKETGKLKKTNLNKDIINQAKIFQLNKNLKDEQKEKRSNLNSFMQSQFEVDILSKQNDKDKTKFNQLLNNIKTVKENEKKEQAFMRENDKNIKRLGRPTNETRERNQEMRNNPNIINSSWIEEQLDNDIDTNEKFF